MYANGSCFVFSLNKLTALRTQRPKIDNLIIHHQITYEEIMWDGTFQIWYR